MIVHTAALVVNLMLRKTLPVKISRLHRDLEQGSVASVDVDHTHLWWCAFDASLDFTVLARTRQRRYGWATPGCLASAFIGIGHASNHRRTGMEEMW